MPLTSRITASSRASTSRLTPSQLHPISPPPPSCTCGGPAIINLPHSSTRRTTQLGTRGLATRLGGIDESREMRLNWQRRGEMSWKNVPVKPDSIRTRLRSISRLPTIPALSIPRSNPQTPSTPFLHSFLSTRTLSTMMMRNQLLPRTTTKMRNFHSTPPNPFRPTSPRRDILFFSVPAVKSVLLTVVRVTLIFLPLAWRWGLFRRFPVASRSLWQIPLLAFCLVLALGLHQSPKTARWRLLLMSEREELAWGTQRFDEVISHESILILPPTDKRVAVVKDVCTRLLQALQDDSPISCANFPREEIIEKIRDRDKRRSITPSATTDNVLMPFLPESSNPEKMLPSMSWDIFVVDLPKINAFVLPSTDIFVYTGLLSVVEDDENLLAACIAHEISHVTERHSVESLGFLALSGVLFDILRGASWALTQSFPMVGDAMAVFFNFLDTQVGRRAFSRKLELEADALGLELMARAGFDPRGALTLWEILSEVEADVVEKGSCGTITDHISLLRTHPTGAQRLEAIRELLPAAIVIYEKTRSGELDTRGLNAVAVAKMQEADRTVKAQGSTLKVVAA